jgi:trehalose/maltose hydrolase-like predicted phosphorylase
LDSNFTVSIDRILVETINSFASYKVLSQTYSKKYDVPMGHVLLDLHIEEWNRVWKSGIEVQSINGNLNLSRAINSSLYYILSSVRDDWPYSLSPGGLSSNDYNGHVFWDCETWMYPIILMLKPNIALGGILDYRAARISEAENKARSYNKSYEGAMFPWESAFTGAEVTPKFASTGIYEQHISGDIIFAIKQYYRSQVTDDELAMFRAKFSPLIIKVARFFASRVTPRPNTNQYDILGVTPPDEYHVNVNNSIYTNVVAQISLDFAIEIANKFHEDIPPSELTKWKTIADNLYMPYDPVMGIHPEYEGYNGEIIKQADVVLLKFPLMWKGYDEVPESVKNDLVYYENVTDRDSVAMTYGMYSIGWLEEGYLDTAAQLFIKSYANIHEPFGVWTETPKGGAINFITGAGGFLQTVMFGYGGLRILEPDTLSQFQHKKILQWNPILPQDITFVRFRGIHFLGNIFNIEFNNDRVNITSIVNTGIIYLRDPSGLVEKLGTFHSFSRTGKFYLYTV